MAEKEEDENMKNDSINMLEFNNKILETQLSDTVEALEETQMKLDEIETLYHQAIQTLKNTDMEENPKIMSVNIANIIFRKFKWKILRLEEVEQEYFRLMNIEKSSIGTQENMIATEEERSRSGITSKEIQPPISQDTKGNFNFK